MISFVGQTLRILPLVYLRMVPSYAVFLFLLYLVYGSEMDAFTRWFLAGITVTPSMSLLVLLALRSGLVQLKVSGPIFPPAIFKGLARLAGFQWIIMLLIQGILFAPMVWALEQYADLPLRQNLTLLLTGLRDFVIAGKAGEIHRAYGYSVMAYGIAYGISAAVMGTAMAGTAATVVQKPPRIDSLWGFGHRFFTLLLLYVPVAFALWTGVVYAYQAGLSQIIFTCIPNSILAAIMPIYLVNFVWLPFFASGAAVAYSQNAQRIETARRNEMEALIAGAQPMPDLRALRQARQDRQNSNP